MDNPCAASSNNDETKHSLLENSKPHFAEPSSCKNCHDECEIFDGEKEFEFHDGVDGN